MHVLLTKLFDDERVDVGFETTSTETNNDDSNDHGTESTVALDNTGNGRDNKNDMTDDVDNQSVADGPVTTPVLIGDVGSEQGHQVLPELVECGDTGRGSLTHSEGTRLLIVGTSNRARRERLLDEVGEHDGTSIVGESRTISIYTQIGVWCIGLTVRKAQ